MEQVIWSKRSVSNLKIIWNFYAKKTITGANSVVNGIRNKGNTLTTNLLHQSEENLKPNQYRTIFKHFKIVYKVKGDRVLILQIFDSRQNPKKLKT